MKCSRDRKLLLTGEFEMGIMTVECARPCDFIVGYVLNTMDAVWRRDEAQAATCGDRMELILF